MFLNPFHESTLMPESCGQEIKQSNLDWNFSQELLGHLADDFNNLAGPVHLSYSSCQIVEFTCPLKLLLITIQCISLFGLGGSRRFFKSSSALRSNK